MVSSEIGGCRDDEDGTVGADEATQQASKLAKVQRQLIQGGCGRDTKSPTTIRAWRRQTALKTPATKEIQGAKGSSGRSPDASYTALQCPLHVFHVTAKGPLA